MLEILTKVQKFLFSLGAAGLENHVYYKLLILLFTILQLDFNYFLLISLVVIFCGMLKFFLLLVYFYFIAVRLQSTFYPTFTVLRLGLLIGIYRAQLTNHGHEGLRKSGITEDQIDVFNDKSLIHHIAIYPDPVKQDCHVVHILTTSPRFQRCHLTSNYLESVRVGECWDRQQIAGGKEQFINLPGYRFRDGWLQFTSPDAQMQLNFIKLVHLVTTLR